MRGTYFKHSLDIICKMVEDTPPEAELITKLAVDRRLLIGKSLIQHFPQYAQSHPVTVSRFNDLMEGWHFRSSTDYISPEQCLEFVELCRTQGIRL